MNVFFSSDWIFSYSYNRVGLYEAYHFSYSDLSIDEATRLLGKGSCVSCTAVLQMGISCSSTFDILVVWIYIPHWFLNSCITDLRSSKQCKPIIHVLFLTYALSNFAKVHLDVHSKFYNCLSSLTISRQLLRIQERRFISTLHTLTINAFPLLPI